MISRVMLLSGLLFVLPASEYALPGTSLVIRVPAGWTQRTDQHGATCAFSPAQGSAGLAVVVTEPLDQGPAAFAQSAYQELQRGATAFAVVDSGFAYVVGTLTWSHVRYRMRVGTTVWEQVAYLTVADRRGIIITGSAIPAEIPALLPVFEQTAITAGLSRPVLSPGR
jgi:hypothetical protein